MRRFISIALCAVVALTATSCFKKEVRGTVMRIAVYSQNVSDDPILPATDLESYAFTIGKNDNWEVATWQDALDKRITNKDRPAETLTTPDYTGTFDAEAEYQVELDVRSEYVFMVIVDYANRIYATRKYETPINLSHVHTQLHLYAWRKSGNANGWTVINPFPDEQREPLAPVEDEEVVEDETTDDTTDQTTNDTTNGATE